MVKREKGMGGEGWGRMGKWTGEEGDRKGGKEIGRE